MTKIKICGLTRREDILTVNQEKPDFAGFVFAKSARQISTEQAAGFIADLSPEICPVGVFVNEAPAEIVKTANCCGLKVLQLHGEESNAVVNWLKQNSGCEIWKAIRVQNQQSLAPIYFGSADRYLVDAYSKQGYGGNGRAFDWSLLKQLPKEQIILAGGLNLQNLVKAVHTVTPWAVDVSSGVESSGKKDPSKIKEFIYTVRQLSVERKEVRDEKR